MHPQELLVGREPAVNSQGPHLEPARTVARLQAATGVGLGFGPHVVGPSVILTALVVVDLPLHPAPSLARFREPDTLQIGGAGFLLGR